MVLNVAINAQPDQANACLQCYNFEIEELALEGILHGTGYMYCKQWDHLQVATPSDYLTNLE